MEDWDVRTWEGAKAGSQPRARRVFAQRSWFKSDLWFFRCRRSGRRVNDVHHALKDGDDGGFMNVEPLLQFFFQGFWEPVANCDRFETPPSAAASCDELVAICDLDGEGISACGGDSGYWLEVIGETKAETLKFGGRVPATRIVALQRKRGRPRPIRPPANTERGEISQPYSV